MDVKLKKERKTEILAEETEKRVSILERKTAKENQVKTVSESAVLKIGTQSKMGKVFEFYCNEKTGMLLNFYVSSATITMTQILVYLNGKNIFQVKGKTSYETEIPFLAEAGRNNVKIECTFSLSGTKTTFEYSASLTGDFAMEETKNAIALLGQKYVAMRYGDSLSFFNTTSLASQIGILGAGKFSFALLNDERVAVLRKEIDGTSKLYVYPQNSFSSSTTSTISENYSSCAMRKVGNYYALYFLKGNFIYERYYSGQSTYSQTKLPIKAKNIRIFSCENHDYFCYVDLFGNLAVSEIEKDAPFKVIKNYTFRKIENPQVYEIDSVCYLSYKCGQLLVERKLNETTDLTVLGVGDEGFRLANGKTVIRKGKQIQLI